MRANPTIFRWSHSTYIPTNRVCLGYPHPDYPVLAEILNWAKITDDDGETQLRFRRPPQLQALETYWYLRLIIEKIIKKHDNSQTIGCNNIMHHMILPIYNNFIPNLTIFLVRISNCSGFSLKEINLYTRFDKSLYTLK